MHARRYVETDRDACLRAFDGNTPPYFLPHEREAFADFLDRLPGPYFVITDADEVIACGGYAIGRVDGEADICWTVVRRNRQGQGVGRRLIDVCLNAIATRTNCNRVRLETSQHTRAFFERLGFTVLETTADGFGPGLDQIQMRKSL